MSTEATSEERVERLLIVEDQASLRRSLARALAPLAREVRCADTVAAARVELEAHPPDAVVLDLALPDGTAFDVLAAAREGGRHPVVIAVSGTATPVDTFKLAQAGVRAFVEKPLTLESLCQALVDAVERPPNYVPFLRAQVGHKPIHALEEEVRAVVVDEALARSGGSKAGAARLLSISRQLLQFILRKERDGAEPEAKRR